MNIERVRKAAQYILAAAGEEDYPSRELGPIHLVKYLYLADLAWAGKHGGQSFFGVRWRFHHFGPWSAEVFRELEPALLAVGATEKTVHSRVRDDFKRWYLKDPQLLDRLESELPSEVAWSIKRNVHRHGSDTADLLYRVYATRPMLHAAPGEYLDLTPEAEQPTFRAASRLSAPKSLSRKEAKAVEARRVELRRRVAEALTRKARGKLTAPSPAPRYDQVFVEGVAWLDSLGGEPIPLIEAEAEFDSGIWKSPFRTEPEVP